MRTRRSNEPTEQAVVASKLLVFLAQGSVDQASDLPDVPSWFFKERKGESSGSNYLFGVVLAYLAYQYALHDQYGSDISLLDALDAHLRSMIARKDKSLWSRSSLEDDAAWRDARRLAKEVQSHFGLTSFRNKGPFKIDELIEVDGYLDGPWSSEQ